jgi:opacity protein-like surface antigen
MPTMLDRAGFGWGFGKVGGLALAVALAVFGAAPAVADDGFYVEIEPGWSLPQDSDLDVRSSFFDEGLAKGDFDVDSTWVIGGAIGFRYGGFRVEIDASHRPIELDQVSLRDPGLAGGGGEIGDDGDLDVTVGLVNAFYGYRIGRFEPFVGGGLGFADVNLDADYGMNVLSVDKNSTEFAWSVSGGVSFAIHEHVDLSLGYRWIGMTDPDLATRAYTRPNPNPPPPNIEFEGTAEFEVTLHEFFAGLRYNF